MTRALTSASERLEDVHDERADADLTRIESLLAIHERSERLLDTLASNSIDRLTGLLDRLQRD
jgi:hypothetical protein